MSKLPEESLAKAATIDDIAATCVTPSGSFNDSFNSEEGAQLLTGVASVLNHFLGGK